MERSWPVTMWMMPDDQFWNPNEVLVSTPDSNYTVNDYHKLFMDLKYLNGIAMRKDVEQLIKGLKPPGVEVHCIHGVNVQTIGTFRYDGGQFPDSQPTIYADNGDGTVNLRSLLGCLRWQHQSQPFYHKVLDKVNHSDILKSGDALQYIKEVLYS